jgi:hypothetical protein
LYPPTLERCKAAVIDGDCPPITAAARKYERIETEEFYWFNFE